MRKEGLFQHPLAIAQVTGRRPVVPTVTAGTATTVGVKCYRRPAAPTAPRARKAKAAPKTIKENQTKKVAKGSKTELTPRQAKLLEGIAQLKSQRQAALAAGYSPATATHACRILEGANVRQEFQTLLRRSVDADKLGQRIAEGLDAMETKLVTYEGQITDRVDLVNWDARLAYIEIAAKYTGYHVDKQEVAVEHDESNLADAGQRLDELLKRLATRTGGKGEPGGTGKAN